MRFKYIPKTHAQELFGYIDFSDAFYRFIDEFNIIGVKCSQPTTISASYFLRLLCDGSSEKARGYGKGNSNENDEINIEAAKIIEYVASNVGRSKIKSASNILKGNATIDGHIRAQLSYHEGY